MGFSLPSELQQYWDAVRTKEVNAWLMTLQVSVKEVEIDTLEGA